MKFKSITLSLLFLILILVLLSIDEPQGDLKSSQINFTKVENDDTINNLDSDNLNSTSQDLSTWSEVKNSDIVFGLIFFTLLLIVNLLIRKNKNHSS